MHSVEGATSDWWSPTIAVPPEDALHCVLAELLNSAKKPVMLARSGRSSEQRTR